MHVIILGAGVVGITTAYFLKEAGAEVTVIDRHSLVGMESSFANGCQLSYSHIEPWASYATLKRVIKWIGKKDAPLYMPLNFDWDMYVWLIKFMLNCPRAKLEKNTLNNMRISFYSKKILLELMDKHKFDFCFHSKGILHIYNNVEYMGKLKQQFEYQAINNKDFKLDILTPEECLHREPALKSYISKICGGIHCIQDAIGDVHQFTLQLSEIAKAKGVKFINNTEVQTFTTSGNKVTGVSTNFGFYTADKYVSALGAYNRLLLKKLGINIPVYPVKGYSITIPINNQHIAPNLGITDQNRKIVYSRLGENYMRISGTAEFAGYTHNIEHERIKPMIEAYQEIFPKGGSFENMKTFACIRPQTPQSSPILGKTKYDNLFINSGHGTLGWTMACGTARVVSDIVLDKKPEIDLDGLVL